MSSVRRKVLHIINGEYYSGAERVQDLLGQKLPDYGYDVHFACIKPDKFPIYCHCPKGIVHQFPMQSRFDVTIVKKLLSHIMQEKYVLIHSHTPRGAIISRLVNISAKLPRVHHIHSPTDSDTEKKITNIINSLAEKYCTKTSNKFIAVSESLKNYLIVGGIDSGRIYVVPNGVPALETCFERPTPEGKWTIGMVALFRPRKGLEILLRAIAELKEKSYPVNLRLIGPFETNEYEDKIRRLCESLQILSMIEWVGFSNNVNAELERLDLFVLPSLYGEGMPMVIIEAMAAGIPVIGSMVEGIPEVIRDGKDGILVKPGDWKSLALAMQQYFDGKVDWQSVRIHSRLRQKKFFSDVSMAQKTAQVYDMVLSK